MTAGLNGAARGGWRAALLGGLLAAAGPAAAVDALADQPAEEILVIAPNYVAQRAGAAAKSDAPLIELPQSVSVVTRDQIDLLSAIDVQQAVRYSAGVVGENYGPDLRFDFLTQRGFVPVQYIDGLQVPRSATIANIGVDLYGFDRIEVLKGPAGALYGTSPPGGIYNLSSRRPGADFGGEAQARYGSDDFKEVAGTVAGALLPGVRARLTALGRDRGGQTDFVDARRAFAAPALAVDLGPDTTLTALGFYQWDRVEGDTNGFLPVAGVLAPNRNGVVPRSVNLGEPDVNFYRREQFSAGYELAHRFGAAATLTQNARWSAYDEAQRIIYATGLAADERTVSRADFPYRDRVRQFAIDTRVNAAFATGALRHDLLVGVDHRNYRERSAFGFGSAPAIDLFAPVYGVNVPAAPAFFPFTDQRVRQTGLYAQNRVRLGALLLTLGGRHDWVRSTDRRATGAPERADDRFTGRAGLTWLTDAGVAPYVSYATSFEPVAGADFGGAPFRPSAGRQVEAGVKYDGRTLGGDARLFATAAAYRLRQTNVLTPDPANAFFNIQTGEATVDGVELEATARLRDQLSLNASYTFADARITRSDFAAQLGARLFGQPRHKASLFVDYSVKDGAFAGLGLGGGVRHTADSPGALPGPFNPQVFFTGEATLFDAIIRYDAPGWRLAVNGSNLFDKRYAGRCTGPVGCFFAQGRQLLATATRRF